MRSRKTFFTDYARHALFVYFSEPDRLTFDSRAEELNHFACRSAVMALTEDEKRAAEAVYAARREANDHECGICRRLEREVARLRELI